MARARVNAGDEPTPQAEGTSDDGRVTVRITKFGNGQVSSGEHVPGEGDRMLWAGETVTLDRTDAEALEARGFAEIQ